MIHKKYQGRFCLQFNTSDSRHQQVIELLEQQDRRKAQFIADAVLYFVNEDAPGSAVINPDQLKRMVFAVVREYLNSKTEAAHFLMQNEPLPVAQEPETIETASYVI